MACWQRCAKRDGRPRHRAASLMPSMSRNLRPSKTAYGSKLTLRSPRNSHGCPPTRRTAPAHRLSHRVRTGISRPPGQPPSRRATTRRSELHPWRLASRGGGEEGPRLKWVVSASARSAPPERARKPGGEHVDLRVSIRLFFLHSAKRAVQRPPLNRGS